MIGVAIAEVEADCEDKAISLVQQTVSKGDFEIVEIEVFLKEENEKD